MTIREINNLRRNGQLVEALAAARTEFADRPNLYSASALFWCLYDRRKTETGPEADATLAEMKKLFSDYCPDDKLMRETLDRVDLRLSPIYKELRTAVEQAKGGRNVSEAYSRLARLHDSGDLNEGLFPEFGWLIYHSLKATPSTLPNQRKEHLSRYFKLGLEKPSLLHSLILGEAIRLEEENPLVFRFRDFTRLWGLENLTDADWDQFKTDSGNVASSHVEKLIKVFAKELRSDGVEAPEELCQLVDKALERFPNNQNLPYHKAIILLSKGQKVEAIGFLTDLIMRFPSKVFLLEQAADIVTDPETKIALLCKALSSNNDDAFLGKVRLKFAALLISKGLLAEARYELDRYKDTYTAKNWGLKHEFMSLQSQVASTAPVSDNRKLYERYLPLADEFIYSSLPTRTAVKVSEAMVDDRKRPGRKVPVWTLRLASGTIRLRKPQAFGLNPRTPNGRAFSVKIKDDRIVWIKPAQGPIKEDWVKVAEGNIKLRTDRRGNAYAIIADAYVGAKLLKNVTEGQPVKILAIRQDDGRWGAVAVAPKE